MTFGQSFGGQTPKSFPIQGPKGLVWISLASAKQQEYISLQTDSSFFFPYISNDLNAKELYSNQTAKARFILALFVGRALRNVWLHPLYESSSLPFSSLFGILLKPVQTGETATPVHVGRIENQYFHHLIRPDLTVTNSPFHSK